MTKRPTCRVCGRRAKARQYKLELHQLDAKYDSFTELVADVETVLCDACADRVADDLANVVMRVRADHLSEVK